jgi:hypothetical protein
MSLQDLENLAEPQTDEERAQASYEAAMAAPDVFLPGRYAALSPGGLLPVPGAVPPQPVAPTPGGVYPGDASGHIPLDHAVALASSSEGPPVATVGMSPRPMPPRPQMINPYEYLLSRGSNLNAHNLNPVFADRLTNAIRDAEAATGQRARLNDLYRPPEQQAQYYADYTRQPVNFNGRTYMPNPSNQGGLAAPPGRSRHEQGTAADVNSGPVLDYLHRNAGNYGLEFLRGQAFANDPVHVQLAGTPGSAGGGGPTNAPGGGIGQVGGLAQQRQSRFAAELQDPDMRRLLAASVNAEVGGQGQGTEQAYIETVMNRALSRNMSLSQAIRDVHYYPSSTISKLGEGFGPNAQQHVNNLIDTVMRGSNISNFSTGNESGSVHSGGAPVGFNPGTGERFVQENADSAWVKAMMAGGGNTSQGNVPPAGGNVPPPAPQPDLQPDQEPEQEPLALPSDEELKSLKDQLDELSKPSAPIGPIEPVEPAAPLPPVELQPSITATPEPAAPEPVAPALPANLGGTQMPPGTSPGVHLLDAPSPPDLSTLTAPTDYIPHFEIPDLSAIPSDLTHTVTGADGMPQTITASSAVADPTIGMTRGIGIAPETMAKLAAGSVPALGTLTAEQQGVQPSTPDEERLLDAVLQGGPVTPGFEPPIAFGKPTPTPDQASMTHTPPVPMTPEQQYKYNLGRALLYELYKYSPPGVIQSGGELLKQLTEAGPQAWDDPEVAQQLAGQSLGTVSGIAGARIPFVKPGELGAAGGKLPSGKLPMGTLPGTPSSGSLVRTGPPLTPIGELLALREQEMGQAATVERDPATGRFVKKAQEPVASEPATEEPAVTAAPAAAAAPAAEPLPATIRFYHGSKGGEDPTSGGSRWVTPSEDYARNFRAAGQPNDVHYVDIPREQLGAGYDETNNTYQHFEAPENIAKQLKPLEPPGPSAAVAPPVTPPAAPAVVAAPSRLTQTGAPKPLIAAPPLAAPAPPPIPPNIPHTPIAPGAPPVRQANVTLGDYLRLGTRATGPVDRFAGKTGLSQAALDNLRDTLHGNSGATSEATAAASAQHGHAETPDFSFKVQNSVPEVQRMTQSIPGFDKYLEMYDTLDDIRAKDAAMRNAQPNLPGTVGPTRVRGVTEADALTAISNAERADPTLPQWRAKFRENIMEARRATSEGEYAIRTPQELADLNASHPNEVPWNDRDVGPEAVNQLGEPIVRPDAFKSTTEYVRNQVRRYLNNVAKGTTVDTLRSAPGAQDAFTFVPEGTKISPSTEGRVVRFMRRGQVERWVAKSKVMADVLNMDPFHHSTGMGEWALAAPRRLFTFFTTGPGAPHFSTIDMIHNYAISQMTVGGAVKGTGPLRLVPSFARSPVSALGIRQALTGQGWGPKIPFTSRLASGPAGPGLRVLPLGPGTLPYSIASRLVPKLAKQISLSLQSTSSKWFRNFVGDQTTNHLATILADTYARSTIAEAQARGLHSGHFVGRNADRIAANALWEQRIKEMLSNPATRTMGALWSLYKELLTSIHGSVQLAYVQRNMGRANLANMSKSDRLTLLTKEANELVGNPLTSGQYYTSTYGGLRPITPDPGNLTGKVGRGLAQTWVAFNELGRTAGPWHNMILQGGKQFGVAAKSNPTEFALRAFAYSTLPAAIGYLIAARAGKDPNGIPYVWHMMNGRTEYDKSMYHYIPIPGLPADQGIELPTTFQENTFMKRGIEAAMDHIYGNNIWTKQQDVQAALTAMLDVAVLPPSNPLISAAFESAGVAAPQNIGAFLPNWMFSGLGQNTSNVDVGGDIYMRRSNPYDKNRTVSQTVESTIRALAPSLSDLGFAGYNAFMHTPSEDGILAAIGNAARQVARTETQREPILRNIADTNKPLTGFTRLTAEMFARDRAIQVLDSFYSTYGLTGETKIGAKPPSKEGGVIAQEVVGPNLPTSIPGLPPGVPTNPLYIEFARELYNRTRHDALSTGGQGYRSIWNRYRDATKALRTMQHVDYGNMVTWQRDVQSRPDLLKDLKAANVDPTNPWAVRNYYERQRQRVTQIINNQITGIEDRFSKKYGRPIKIQELDPYGAPDTTASYVPEAVITPPWTMESATP